MKLDLDDNQNRSLFERLHRQAGLTAGAWEEDLHPRGYHGEFGRKVSPELPTETSNEAAAPRSKAVTEWTPGRSPEDRFGNYDATSGTRQKTIEKARAKIGDPALFGMKYFTVDDDSEVKRLQGLVDVTAQRIADLKTKLPNAPDKDELRETQPRDSTGWAPRDWVDGKDTIRAIIESEQYTLTRLTAKRDEARDWALKADPELARAGFVIQPDRAPDGGPTKEVMDKLRALKDAGKAIRIAADKTMEGNPAVKQWVAINKQRAEIRRAAEAWSKKLLDADNAEQDDYAKLKGYDDWFDLQNRGTSEDLGKAAVVSRVLARERGEKEMPKALEKRMIEDVRLKGEQDDLQEQIASDRRDTYLAMLGGHRQMGGLLEYDYKPPPGGSDPASDRLAAQRLTKALDHASNHYPADWLARVPKVNVTTSARGYFRKDQNEIALSATMPALRGQPMSGSVAIHELGHDMEANIPGLTAAEWAYYWGRTSKGNYGHRSREMPEWLGPGYGNDEITRKDQFGDPYSGKVYGFLSYDSPTQSYEIFTTGMEAVMGGQTGYVMPKGKRDDDYIDFVLGALATL